MPPTPPLSTPIMAAAYSECRGRGDPRKEITCSMHGNGCFWGSHSVVKGLTHSIFWDISINHVNYIDLYMEKKSLGNL